MSRNYRGKGIYRKEDEKEPDRIMLFPAGGAATRVAGGTIGGTRARKREIGRGSAAVPDCASNMAAKRKGFTDLALRSSLAANLPRRAFLFHFASILEETCFPFFTSGTLTYPRSA